MSDQVRKERRPIRATAVVAIIVSVLFIAAMTTIYFLTRSDINKEIDDLLDRRKEKVESMMTSMGYAMSWSGYLDAEYVSSYTMEVEEDDLMTNEAYIPGTTRYIDPDGDSMEVWDVNLLGYSYRSYLGWTSEENPEGQKKVYYQISEPYGMTVESTDKNDLRFSLMDILEEGNERGFLKSFRYLVFKVPFLLTTKESYVNTTLGILKSDGYPYVLSPEIGPMETHDGSDFSFSAEEGDEALTAYLPVILFEDTASHKQAYAYRMLRYALILAAIGLAFVLFTAIFERAIVRKAPAKEKEEVLAPEAPSHILSEDQVRDLMHHVDQAEQSMGPNGYLDEIRKDLKTILGKEEKEEEA